MNWDDSNKQQTIPTSHPDAYEVKDDCVFVYSQMGFEYTISKWEYFNWLETQKKKAREFFEFLELMNMKK